MDYEKAYKAVLKTATQWIKDGCTDKEKICLECVFPELRESEDERNIDTIFNCLYQCCDTGFISGTQRDNALAYLEKQKEQMMKDAVEGEVVKDINNKLAVTAKNVNLDKFKFGEKVRIIIVKED